MHLFIQQLVDYIFPPSIEEIKLRDISPQDMLTVSEKVLRTEFPFIKAVFSYKDPLIRELIWQIKYKKNMHAVRCAGYALHSELLKICEKVNIKNTENLPNLDKIILIPIPISKKRRKERGYNQCELVIDEIVKLDTQNKFTKDFNLIIREKDIPKQTFKNRDERINNTKHIFKVLKNPDVICDEKNPNMIYDANTKIIIIDDVTTTGSTLKEARDELLKVGYKDVTGLTIAH